ncbi:hypothetical protein AMTR_s00142p00081110 [Amborella trichopoda]|uniref:Uncharacterized protein n=2 Tax=Amborella trichopoda TaxID=13333 RepID=W1PEC6_AMBTC|nr:hypothetical protein AMTR_s00142p00081110 [Amborella trichopoda]
MAPNSIASRTRSCTCPSGSSLLPDEGKERVQVVKKGNAAKRAQSQSKSESTRYAVEPQTDSSECELNSDSDSIMIVDAEREGDSSVFGAQPQSVIDLTDGSDSVTSSTSGSKMMGHETNDLDSDDDLSAYIVKPFVPAKIGPCIAHRTRSQFGRPASSSSFIANRTRVGFGRFPDQMLGTVSRPICIDEEVPVSSSCLPPSSPHSSSSSPRSSSSSYSSSSSSSCGDDSDDMDYKISNDDDDDDDGGGGGGGDDDDDDDDDGDNDESDDVMAEAKVMVEKPEIEEGSHSNSKENCGRRKKVLGGCSDDSTSQRKEVAVQQEEIGSQPKAKRACGRRKRNFEEEANDDTGDEVEEALPTGESLHTVMGLVSERGEDVSNFSYDDDHDEEGLHVVFERREENVPNCPYSDDHNEEGMHSKTMEVSERRGEDVPSCSYKADHDVVSERKVEEAPPRKEELFCEISGIGGKEKISKEDGTNDGCCNEDCDVAAEKNEEVTPQQKKESVYKRNEISAKKRKIVEEDADDTADRNAGMAASNGERLNSKKKRIRGKRTEGWQDKADALFNDMLKTIRQKQENLPKKWTPKEDVKKVPQVSPMQDYTNFPLKFYFGEDKESNKEKEKTAEEEELDELWREFNFALECQSLENMNPSTMNSNIASNLPEAESKSSNSCSEGGHLYIINDQIGIVCRYCHHVQLEIQYVLPPFVTNVTRKSRKKNSDEEGNASLLGATFSQEVNVLPCNYSTPSKGTVWDMIPGVKNRMHAHQIEGFEFLWYNLAGGITLDKLKPEGSEGIGGCVISHAPGTGKTLLTIAFLQSFMQVYPDCKPILIAPLSMMCSWREELKKWKVDISLHILNIDAFSREEDAAMHEMVSEYTSDKTLVRLVKIYSWSKGRSILGISYELFSKLTMEEHKTKDKRKYKEIQELLFKESGLLVLDEGHTARNQSSNIWKALTQVKTLRRIMLSGTPFQNNFIELFNTLYLVRPFFADDIFEMSSLNHPFWLRNLSEKKRAARIRSSFMAKIGHKIECRKEDSNECLAVLRNMVDPFIHSHDGSVLDNLPGLREYKVVLILFPIQDTILKSKMSKVNLFDNECIVSSVAIHPSLLKSPSKEDMLKFKLDDIRLKWEEGVKTRFVIDLIRLSNVANERVLIFSQYIPPLRLLMHQLVSCFGWKEGCEILQLDGDVRDVGLRQSMIHKFNDPNSEARVVLVSIRACSEGINLTGASRVILLDPVWNPAVVKQAVSRAFRLGQKKIVYIYHLIAHETLEQQKYDRHAWKSCLSKSVFGTAEEHKEEQRINGTDIEDDILRELFENARCMFEGIY